MTEQDRAEMAEMQAKQPSGSAGYSAADEIAKLDALKDRARSREPSTRT